MTFAIGSKKKSLFLLKGVRLKMEKKIREKLEELRVHLQADGGDMEIISIDGKKVNLRLKGACGTCPHATITIKEGIQRVLREEIDPEITVERVE
jgi:Fe-S cluster biogenesis protein NfuA